MLIETVRPVKKALALKTEAFLKQDDIMITLLQPGRQF